VPARNAFTAAAVGSVVLMSGLTMTACASSRAAATRAAPSTPPTNAPITTAGPPVPSSAAPRSAPAVSRITGATYYVAPSGSDTAPGSPRRPLRTIAYALRRLHAGDRLFIRGGVYVERVKVTAAPGAANARVTVAAFGHEHPLIVGELWIGEPSYWTISGISVTWGPGDPDEPMARIYGGTGWILRGSTLFSSHSTSALQIDDGPLNDLGSWTVTGNCIHDTFRHHGDNQDNNVYVEDMTGSPHPSGIIEHNIIYNAPNGRGIKLGPGGSVGGPRSVVVRYNTIYNSEQNISVSRQSADVSISNNILMRATDANLASFDLSGTNNTAVANVAGSAARFVDRSGGSEQLQLAANRWPARLTFDQISCSGFHPSAWRNDGAYG
jgi:hypothetical protein